MENYRFLMLVHGRNVELGGNKAKILYNYN